MSSKKKEQQIYSSKQDACLNCLACCKSLVFQVSSHPETINFYKTVGCKIHYNLFVSGKFIFVEVPHICDKLTEKGCSIYDKRPLSCQRFDGRTNIVTQNSCLWHKMKEI
ncbi:MAG: hypothetical protein BWX92_02888 [Deltaproteobacteria bacterium ADurb.Bin135]|nr:MAG: hypothetical protein BWX92_02888 [Deltaproteobacteria bacterium ADurb.Bin135]